MKVLVVDDYATMRRIMRNLLSQLHISDVSEASNVETALRELRNSKYSLILCNDTLPPQTGLDLLKAVRDDSELSHISFIMVFDETTHTTENFIATKTAGANNIIRKPFNAETLKEKIVSVCGPL